MEEDDGMVKKKPVAKKSKKAQNGKHKKMKKMAKKPAKMKKITAKKATSRKFTMKKPAKAKGKTFTVKKASGAKMKMKKTQKAAASAKAPRPVQHFEQRKPRCIVLAGFGLNAEAELAHAFTLAGADAEIVHFSDISSGKKHLSNYEIFAIPGGWSFGDDIAGGRVLSNKLKHTFVRSSASLWRPASPS